MDTKHVAAIKTQTVITIYPKTKKINFWDPSTYTESIKKDI